jgi:hypothetical protein
VIPKRDGRKRRPARPPWRITDAIEAPHRLGMGLASIPPGEPWIEVDDALAEDLAEKRRLLGRHHDAVFVEQPTSRAAQQEALGRVVDALLRDHADDYALEHGCVGRRGIRIRALGETLGLEGGTMAPLERAARLVQEDLCLMEPGPSGWCLTAGAVCFPTRWSLRPMLGRPMTSIHERVPGYREALDRSANRFFDGMKAGSVFRRSNWSLMDDPALFQPSGKYRTSPRHDIDTANAGERVWLRVERQTLQRLPESGAILFGIRIHRARLDAVAREAEGARALLDAIATMHPAMQRYKSLLPIRDAVVAHLESRLAASGEGAC